MDQGNENTTLTTVTTNSSKRGGGGGKSSQNNNQHNSSSVATTTTTTLPTTAITSLVHSNQTDSEQQQPIEPVVVTPVIEATSQSLQPVVHTEMLPPELRDVFEISSFIAHARPMMKPCFRTRSYVTKDSWLGAIFRRFHGESAMLGALQIQRISERLSSSLQQYRGKIWEPTIRTHLIEFLKGVKIIQETYYDYTEVTPILCTTILTGEHALNSVRPVSASASVASSGGGGGGGIYPGTSVSSQTIFSN